MRVIIEPHNHLWKEEFRVVRDSLTRALNGIPRFSIQHVGSTSVEGLPAKPVIDIDVIVDAAHLGAARTALSAAGYTDVGDMNVPGRYAFRQPGYTSATWINTQTPLEGVNDESKVFRDTPLGLRRNTYVVEEGCKALQNHLDVKRILMEDEELRFEYGELKWRLSAREFAHISEYVNAKSDILQKILAKAGWPQADLDELRRINS